MRVTTQLHKAGEILNIPLLDHIIFTAQKETFFSFKDNKQSSINLRNEAESGVSSK
jgi:DNA repair protein RadC